MRRLTVILTALAAFMAIGVGAAFAWPAPVITGDCDNWYITETAPDHDWKAAKYWTIDGVDGQFERGKTVAVADSDSIERSFRVRWFDKNGAQLDKRSTTGQRDLSGCEPPPMFS